MLSNSYPITQLAHRLGHADPSITLSIYSHVAKEMEIDVDDFTFYEVYGLFRLAGIAQQIYYRYHHKQTNNPAFKNFWIFIHYLMWRCNKAIKASGKR